MLHTRRRIFCKAANMKLIDHQIAHISGRLRHLTPVKGILYHSGPVVTFQLLSPGMFSDDCSCIRIQQNLFPVKQKTFPRIAGTVHPVGIFKFLNIQAKDNHGIDITNLIGCRKRKHCVRFFFSFMEQQQFTGCPMMGMHGKIHPHREECCSKIFKITGSYRISGNFPHRACGYRKTRCISSCIILQIYGFLSLYSAFSVRKKTPS